MRVSPFVHLIAYAITFFSISNCALADIPGASPGGFSVTDGGAASYSMPIVIPKGTAGVQPKISVAYNSQGGNGILGVGGSLTGLSAIGRCSQKKAVHGQSRGPWYDGSDRFCLDGQLLILTSGAYGQPESEYRTEVETFTKVIAKGSTPNANGGTAPLYFIVKMKNGTTMWLGDDFASRIRVPGKTTVHRWMMSRVQDKFHNFYKVNYEMSGPNLDQCLPKEILYTGNDNQSLVPDKKIEFEYTNRADHSTTWIAGGKFKSSQALRKISVKINNDQVVRDYNFSYALSPVTRRTTLAAISECGYDDAGDKKCMPQKKFDRVEQPTSQIADNNYRLPGNDVFLEYRQTQSAQSRIHLNKGQLVDVNGDGLKDWVKSYRDTDGSDHRATYLNTGSGLSSTPSAQWKLPDYINDYKYALGSDGDAHLGNLTINRGQFIDINGDGMVDWVRGYQNGNTEYKYTWLNNGNGWTASPTNYVLPGVLSSKKHGWQTHQFTTGMLLDLNGDRLPDYLRAFIGPCGAQYRDTWLNDGDGTWTKSTPYRLPDWISDSRPYTNPGVCWPHTNSAENKTLVRGDFIDVNGDGLPDWVRAYRSEANVSMKAVWINTGSGWSRNDDFNVPFVVHFHAGNKPLVNSGNYIDVNGDGLTDLLISYRSKSGTDYKYTYINKGDGWANDDNYKLPTLHADYAAETGQVINQGQFVDMNNDGRLDWVRHVKYPSGTIYKQTYTNTGTGWLGHTAAFPPPDLLYNYKMVYDNPYNHLWPRIKEGVSYGRFVDMNGDGAADWVRGFKVPAATASGGVWNNRATVARAVSPDRVSEITNSAGAKTLITYKPMSNPEVYTKLDIDDYPVAWMKNPVSRVTDLVAPTMLVSRSRTSNGIGGYFGTSYNYAGARADSWGRGFLGFRWIETENEQTGFISKKDKWQHFPFIGATHKTETFSNLGIKLAHSSTGFSQMRLDFANGNKTYYVRTQVAHSKSYELDGSLITSKTETFEYDNIPSGTWNIDAGSFYGNLTKSTTSISGAGETYTSESNIKYKQWPEFWVLGLPEETTVTVNHPTKPSVTTVAKAAYLGSMAPHTTWSDVGTPFEMRTQFTYDGFGNVKTTSISGTGVPARTSTVNYSPDGLYSTSAENHLGYTTYVDQYNKRCSSATQTRDANELPSTTEFDHYCRPRTVTNADGTQSHTSYQRAGYPGELFVQAWGTNQPQSRQYFDVLMRPFHSRGLNYNGEWVGSDTRFDNRGRAYRSSHPYVVSDVNVLPIINANNGATRWSTKEYDELNRPTIVTFADGTGATSTYDGLTTVSTNYQGQSTTTIKNGRGEIVQRIDSNGGVTHYTFDAQGNLVQTLDPNQNAINVEYHINGKRKRLDDPDIGVWIYTYDRLGQLITEEDAKGQITKLDYDTLGRITKRTTGFGLPDAKESTWTYDTAPNGIGKLHTAASDGYLRTHTYDALGRPDITTDTVLGHTATFRTDYHPTNGRVQAQHYDGKVKLRYHYLPGGFPEKITDLDTGELYWKVGDDDTATEDIDVYGRMRTQTLGNGVVSDFYYYNSTGRLGRIRSGVGSPGNSPIQFLTYFYDSIGNLTKRQDTLATTGEVRFDIFAYDVLNRLIETSTTVDVNGPNEQLKTVSVSYDAVGNILSKSDVGQYEYSGPLATLGGPNALKRVVGGIHFDPQQFGFPTPAVNPYGDYFYDANGNLIASGAIKDANGDFQSWGRQIDWTTFNKPSAIQTPDVTTQFSYGPENQRIHKSTQKGSDSESIIYYGKSMERRVKNGELTFKFYLTMGQATLEKEFTPATNVWSDRYLLKDRLGSTDVITDANANVVERLSFDPWGNRRQSDWQHSPVLIESSSSRGFTGHEMDDESGLINMNARIYDPVLGRFLSADTVLPDASNSQAFNRYAYVMNSPMGYTDPSGHRPAGMRACGRDRDCTSQEIASWERQQVVNSDRNFIAQEYLDGEVSKDTLYGLRNEHINNVKAVVGCPDCAVETILRFATGERDLAEFGIGGSEAEALVYGLQVAKVAHEWIDSIDRSAKIGNIMTIVQIGVTIVAPGLSPLQAAAFSGTATFVTTGGDIEASVISALSSGAYGVAGGALEGGQLIAAHGAIGGISAAASGGDPLSGAAAAIVGKSITLAGDNAGWTNTEIGLASIGGAALSAEIAGGDPALAAVQAAAGFAYNYMGGRVANGPPTECDAGCAVDGVMFAASLTGGSGGVVAAHTFVGRLRLWLNGKRYDSRVRIRGLQDPKGHNYPYSFDDTVLSTKPLHQGNGYWKYYKTGQLNGSKGGFEIGVNNRGIIDHRHFKGY